MSREGEKPVEIVEAQEETCVIDGIKHKKVPTEYTLRSFFSHKGPGWDNRFDTLEKYGVEEAADLPNEPLYEWVPIEEN